MICIGYRESEAAESREVEIQPPYYLFGTQQTSKRFWSLPIWPQIGVRQLAELGATDPIYFIGWDMMEELRREIDCYSTHIGEIPFDSHLKSTWLAHLVYCHTLLSSSAPPASIPELTIG